MMSGSKQRARADALAGAAPGRRPARWNEPIRREVMRRAAPCAGQTAPGRRVRGAEKD